MTSNRLNQLLELIKNSPGDSFLTFAIAKEYEGLGDEKNALKNYLLLLENDKLNMLARIITLGKLYERLEEPEKAFSAYKEGMKIARSQGDQHSYNELAGAKLKSWR